jgi:hypothetical protein
MRPNLQRPSLQAEVVAPSEAPVEAEEDPDKDGEARSQLLPWPPIPRRVAARFDALGRRPQLAVPRRRTFLPIGKGNSGWNSVGMYKLARGNHWVVSMYDKARGTMVQQTGVLYPFTEEGAILAAMAADAERIKRELLPKNFDPKTGLALTKTLVGVTFHENSGKWKAQIYVGERMRSIGYFGKLEEAKLAYDQKALDYGLDTNFVYE